MWQKRPRANIDDERKVCIDFPRRREKSVKTATTNHRERLNRSYPTHETVCAEDFFLYLNAESHASRVIINIYVSHLVCVCVYEEERDGVLCY